MRPIIPPYTTEDWVTIPDTEDMYWIGRWDKGQVYSLYSDKLLVKCLDSDGYEIVCIYRNGVKYTEKVHSLVAEAFIGPRPDGYEVNHKDGDKTNNDWRNLEYVTASQNQHHAYDTGLKFGRKGEDNGLSKITEVGVRDIRLRVFNGERHKSIAKDYGIHEAHISLIVNGVNWGHIKQEEFCGPVVPIGYHKRGSKNGSSDLVESDIPVIYHRYFDGNETQKEIAKDYGVSQMTISLIVRRERWAHVEV